MKTETTDRGSRVIGRSAEWSRLSRAFESARLGNGGVVLLAGEAGVGKTLLAEEALANSGLRVFIGRTFEEATPPYMPIAAALRDCMRQTPDETLDCGPLRRYLHLLLPELGAPPDRADREILTEAIAAAFSAVSHKHPSALFLDDLHWADHATLELLPALADRLDTVPLLILGTYRSDEIPRGHRVRWLRNELRRKRRLQELVVNPLDVADCSELVGRVLGETPSRSLVELIQEKTQGVPLFVEELAGALATAGRICPGDAGAELIPGEDLPIPDSLRDAVLLRLDGLPEPSRELLQVAAVAGLEFDLQLVAELAGDASGLDELMDRNLLVEASPGVGAFRHALTREAVRSEIAWSRRRSLNRDIARYLEAAGSSPELIAEHWLAANELEKARLALLDSAESSCNLYAYRDASRAANKALEIWPEGKEEHERLQALERLAHCAQISGQLAEAARAWREVLQSPGLGDDDQRRGESLRALATVHGLQGAWDQALEARKGAAGCFERAGRTGDAAVEWLAAAARYTATLRLPDAIEACRRASRLAGDVERWDVQARALGLEGNVLSMQGSFEEGRQVIHAGLSLALKHNITEAASEVYRRLASSLEYASDYPGAREAYTSALNYCRNEGADVQAQLCLSCMSYVFFHTGEWKRAVEICREVLADKRASLGSRSIAVGVLGLVRAYRGETRRARRRLQESLRLARRANATAAELIALWSLATVEEQDGADAEAESYYRQLLAVCESTKERHDAIPALCSATTFFAAHGFEKETTQTADALAEIASVTGNPEALAGLAYALAETALLSRNLEEAAQQFTRALAHLENLELPIEWIKTGFRAGVTLARAGSRDAAIQHLTNSYRLARKLGARPLAAEIGGELESLGVPAEEGRSAEAAERTHRSGLTRRQLQIARLMASGLTNKEIASKLYLSPRTVDMHVSHVLDRLNCRSRTEAVRKAAELGILGDE